MDFHHKKDVQNKRESAGFISRLLFLWMIPLFKKGSKKDIDIDDLENVPEKNRSEDLSNMLQEEWDKECLKSAKGSSDKKPSLFHAFLRTFGRRYALFVSMFMFDNWVVRISQPVFLRLYIKSFSDSSVSLEWQCLYAAGVCVTTLCHVLFNHPSAFQMCVSGMKCRVAVSSLIYQKSLRLSKAAEGKSSVGQIVNLLSNDVSRFDYNLHFIAFLFVGPVQLFLFFALLWSELGLASIVGVGYVLLLSPSQFLIGKLSAVFRVAIGQQTDERSRVMSEIIIAMRLIKMYAWQTPFVKLINRLRKLEVKALKKRSILRATFMGVFTSNFTFVPFLTILTYALLGNPVTPDKAFFAVAIFNVMTEVMMYFVPNAAASVGELVTSIHRLQDFLLMEEHGKSSNFKNNEHLKANELPSISMDGLSARWDEDKFGLKDLNFKLEGDKLVMIIGPVGSGKTSLFHCILSELPIDKGFCHISGRTAYASQEAWIFPGTIRQNILLGKDYSKERYNKIVEVCALEDDLKQFPNGEMTIVGERGVSLSGGQKARINLARGLYQEADIYLLDDPLSAVDTAVSRHIFEKCISTYLKGRLRVLITHQLQYLPQSDYVMVVNEGRILAQGTYNDLVKQGVDFVKLLAEENENNDKEEAQTKAKPTEKILDTESEEENKTDGQNPNRESMAEGAVSGKTYGNYFQSGNSICGISFLISAFILNQLIVSGTDYWLSLWTNEEAGKVYRLEASEYTDYQDVFPNNSSETISFNDTSILTPNQSNFAYIHKPTDAYYVDELYSIWSQHFYVIIYAAFALAVIIVGTTRTLYFFDYTMKISTNIHNKMFESLVRAPIKFFDKNSSGRIMNRFTKDIGALDEYLPLTMFDTLDIGLRMVGTLVLIIVANVYLLIPAVILLTLYRFIRLFYMKTSRSIKRIETCTRSPLYTHLASSVEGLTTIRSSRAQKVLIKQFDCHQDLHSAAWYHFLAGNNWLSIWLEITSTIFIAVVTFSFLGLAQYTTSGKVGLSVALLLQLMNIFQFGMRQSAEMENNMTSVERTLEYTKLEAEVTRKSKKYSDKKPPKEWPSNGAIRFNHVYLSYDGGEKYILRDLNFTINAREKIGIVGRTGAGKSSIIAALFRMADHEGEIAIDGYDISAIGLSKLRKSMSIIPQDPVLFSGTIRYNLDPFDSFSDEELWKVLEEVELKEAVPALDYKVNEGGKNYSVGQRQLVCLARAILRNNKIIVMDEATANVDPLTDNLIQKTIRTKFADCTIITIAHRLQSVMDCNKILVLDYGSLKEFDHPHILLQNSDGYLQRMIAETGNATQNNLRQIAKEAYSTNN